MPQKIARFEVSIDEINAKNSENVYKFVDRGENAYKEQIEEIANQIKIYGKKIVLITGPSSSGKTTSSYKLKEELKKIGIKSYVLNMDDFFKDLDTVPLREDGLPDMEDIVALDVEEIKKCMSQILTSGETMLPTFDFKTHKRSDRYISCKLSDNEVIIMEGIHALNPVITEGLDGDKIYRIYVHCNTNFVLHGKTIMFARELRLLRRIVRDERERHTSCRDTLDMWASVCEGEEKNIRPFKPVANYLLNTTLFYEPLLYKDMLLSEFEKNKENGEIKGLLEKLKYFSTVSPQFVPKDSLVREFIGE